jgi:hypothetical protein
MGLGAPDFGKWVGGVMQASEGGNSPIARNTMASQLVAHGKRIFGSKCDVLVIAVPAGMGEAFMEKFVEGVGENPDLQASVDL